MSTPLSESLQNAHSVPSNGTPEADAPGASGNDKPATPPRDLLKKTAFHIIFEGTPQAHTTSVSSAVLKTAADAGEIPDVNLETVRSCGNLPKAYLFCISGTNVVEDTTTLGEYVSLTKDNVTALRDAAAAGTSAMLTIQYASRHRPPKELPKPPTLTTAPADESKKQEIDKKPPVGVSIATTGMAAGSGNIASTHPAEMTAKEWNYKARNPAFKLKASFSDPFHRPAGTGKKKSVVVTDDQFCIPAFEVNDESSVTITEVKTTLQLSMAQHAFNSSSVEASASGGVGAISGGASASASWLHSTSSASNLGKEMDRLHASYNFPRVKVFLDSEDLVITEECKNLLGSIKTHRKLEDVKKFYSKYGHIFASSVQLGGRLHTTRDSSAYDLKTLEAKKDSLKVAAGASFSSPYASASVSASHQQTNDDDSGKAQGKSSQNLTWEAQGGETLLGSNPPAWITTVGSYNNWRVIERSNVKNIVDLLKDISDGQDDWSTIFSDIDKVHTRAGNPLVFIDTFPELEVIHITNNGKTSIRVAISDANWNMELPAYHEIHAGESKEWKRGGDECVFMNEVNSNRVAIAMAKPGLYEIEELDSNDPNCSYSANDLSDKIGIKNTTSSAILVKITTPPHCNNSARFFSVGAGETERWRRSDFETIFVKHPSSNALHTYVGRIGRDLLVGAPSPSTLPHFHSLPQGSAINVLNAQKGEINVSISSATSDEGRVIFFPIKPDQQEKWTRDGEEVIFVNGPHGTAVGAYYGSSSSTLIVSHPITYEGK